MSIGYAIFIGILCFGLGVVIGLIPSNIVGTFTINQSDPSKDLFAIKFTKDMNVISKSGYITFKVENVLNGMVKK